MYLQSVGLVDIFLGQVDVLIDGFLVDFVDLGDSEETNDNWKNKDYQLLNIINFYYKSELFVTLKIKQESKLTESSQADSGEPGSNVGQSPEQNSEFDGIENVLDQKETAESVGGILAVLDDQVSLGMGLFLGDGDFGFQIWLERVGSVGLLELTFSQLEHTESEGTGQKKEGGPGDQGDDGELGDEDEGKKGEGEGAGALLGVSPFQDVQNWKQNN